MVEKYGNYVALTMDDFKSASEPTSANDFAREPIKIDLNEKTSTIAEPVKNPEKNLNIGAKTK